MFNTLSPNNPVCRLLEPQSSYLIPFDDVLLLGWDAPPGVPPTSIATATQLLELLDRYADGREFCDDDPPTTLERLGLAEADFTVGEPWDQFPIVGDLLDIWDVTGRYVTPTSTTRTRPITTCARPRAPAVDRGVRCGGRGQPPWPAGHGLEARARAGPPQPHLPHHRTRRPSASTAAATRRSRSWPLPARPTRPDDPQPEDDFDTRPAQVPPQHRHHRLDGLLLVVCAVRALRPHRRTRDRPLLRRRREQPGLRRLRRFVVGFIESIEPDTPQIWQWERHIEVPKAAPATRCGRCGLSRRVNRKRTWAPMYRNRPTPRRALRSRRSPKLRELFADAPEVGKKALENVLEELTLAGGPRSRRRRWRAPAASAAALGKVSELTIIVPFATGGAERLRAFLQLLGGNFARRGQGRQRPRHALRVPRQRHEDALRDRLRRRLGRLHRRLRDEDPGRAGHHLLRAARAGPASTARRPRTTSPSYQVTAEGWYVAQSGPDGGGDEAAGARRQGRSTSSSTRSATSDMPTRSADRRPVELDDIQATVLRYRPEPYYGTHVMLHVDDARAGREFLRRLTPHVDSAADWWQAGERLDRGRAHLLRAGGARRAGGLAAELPGGVPRGHGRARRPAARPRGRTIRSTGSRRSAPARSTSGSASSATPRRPGAAPWTRRGSSYEGLAGADGAHGRRTSAPSRATSTRSATRTRSVSPPSRAAASSRCPVRDRPIKAGEFILGYPGEAGVPLPTPQPDVLGRNGTYVGLRKYQSRVGAFNRFLRDERARPSDERELLAAKLVGRWRSGAPLTLAPDAGRPGARRGPAAEQRLHLRRRSARPAGAARLRTCGG